MEEDRLAATVTVLQQLNQRGLFLASFLGTLALADITHERVKAAGATHSNRPNRRFHWKLVAIAMQSYQLDHFV